MNLPEQFHCPKCGGRLKIGPAETLHCAICEQTIPVVDGILDFAGSFMRSAGRPKVDLSGLDELGRMEDGHTQLLTRIISAADTRWPASLGDTLQFGCGDGQVTEAIVASRNVRGLVILDTDLAALQACQARIAAFSPEPDPRFVFATFRTGQDVFRDASADTLLWTGSPVGTCDMPAFLTRVHRVLKPHGRAVFVLPNRRYHQAMALAMAEALVQQYARDGAWPDGHQTALALLSRIRRLLIHRAEAGADELFDSDLVQDLALEGGFKTAEIIPLDPDPAGAETMHRFCQQAASPATFTEAFAVLAATVGQPFFSLLNRQDTSARMLLWLTKAPGPAVRIFTSRPQPDVDHVAVESALGGAEPHWSVEVTAQETPGGIVLSIGGWCLCNVDVQWVRLTLNEVTRHAPVWRPRPDVHGVLNRTGIYHPLNTLCSGMTAALLFDDLHAEGAAVPFRFDIVLANGLIVSGPGPQMLLIGELTVMTH